MSGTGLREERPQDLCPPPACEGNSPGQAEATRLLSPPLPAAPACQELPHLSPFTGSATHGSRVILPLATNERSHNCHSLERGGSISSYQSRSMTAGLLESAPMHRRRHRTRITFPSTTPVAWNQEPGLPRREVPVLPVLQAAGLLPGQRGDTQADPQAKPGGG